MRNNYIQFRFQKIKGVSSVGQVLAHNDRTSKESKTKVDCSRSSLNIHRSVGNAKGKELLAVWKKKRAMFKARKNGVDLLEAVITCTDDAAVDPQRWHAAVEKWAVRHFGKDAILQVSTHLDEKTLHSHVSILPLVTDPKTQERKLSANAIMGNRKKLASWQDSVALEIGQPFGMRRGRPKTETGRENESLQEYRARMAAASKLESMDEVEGFFQAKKKLKALETKLQTVKIEAADAVFTKEMYEKANQNQGETIRNLSVELDTVKQQNTTLINENSRTKSERDALWKQMRGIELPAIMEKWGYSPDRKEGQEWVYSTQAGKVSVNVEKNIFSIDWGGRKGGSGAIDLVCTLDGCTPKEAMQTLQHAFDSDSVCSARIAHVSKTPLPPPANIDETLAVKARRDDSKWPIARNYLVTKRRLDPVIVDSEFSQGKIWANQFGSAVFAHRNQDGKTVGATIRGTQDWCEDFKQTLGKKDGGGYEIGDSRQKNLVVVESPIDAISVHQSTKMNVISVSGNSVPQRVLSRNQLLWIGFDADKAGDDGFYRAKEQRADIERIRPREKDWNAELISHGGSSILEYFRKMFAEFAEKVRNMKEGMRW